MIDRSDAVNLAHNIAEHACRLVSERGAKCLADAVLAMDEYIRSHEADQRDAALEEAADRLQEEYLTDKTGDPSDDAYNRAVSDCINAVNAMRQSDIEERKP